MAFGLPRRGRLAAAAAAGGLGLLLALELAEEPGLTTAGLALELLQLLPVATAAIGVIVLWNRARQRQEALDAERLQDERAAAQGRRWRAEARIWVGGLRDAMELQFARWNLTREEREVALLLLAGRSVRATAEALRSEARIVRAHERSLYAKSRLGGRGALAAYFLEDLSVPLADNRVDTDLGPARRLRGAGVRRPR